MNPRCVVNVDAGSMSVCVIVCLLVWSCATKHLVFSIPLQFVAAEEAAAEVELRLLNAASTKH